MQLREATAADAGELNELLMGLGYFKAINEIQQQLGLIQKFEFGRIIVAVSDSLIVGFVSVSWKPQLRFCGLSMEIDELIVAEESRGRRIGSMLIEHAKTVASQLGVIQIGLSTNRERDSYKREFYKKNGFREKNSALFVADI